MLILAYAADIVAFLALVVGMARWGHLSTPQRLTAAFCGVSAACGAGQAVLEMNGVSTAYFGNLWDLAVLSLLVPALWLGLRRRRRTFVKTAWAVAMALWLSCVLLDDGMGVFGFAVSSTVYGVAATAALLLAEQFSADSASAMRSPAFARSTTILMVCTVDALVTAMLANPDVFGLPFLRAAFTFRNLLWLVGYGSLGGSLLLTERKPRCAPGPDPRAAVMTMSLS